MSNECAYKDFAAAHVLPWLAGSATLDSNLIESETRDGVIQFCFDALPLTQTVKMPRTSRGEDGSEEYIISHPNRLFIQFVNAWLDRQKKYNGLSIRALNRFEVGADQTKVRLEDGFEQDSYNPYSSFRRNRYNSEDADGLLIVEYAYGPLRNSKSFNANLANFYTDAIQAASLKRLSEWLSPERPQRDWEAEYRAKVRSARYRLENPAPSLPPLKSQFFAHLPREEVEWNDSGFGGY